MALNFRKADRLRTLFNGCEIMMETFERELCVRGYHVYQRIWTAAVGEVLHCEREPTNSRDRYAVAVKIFVRKIFVSPDIYKNILTTKISRSTVYTFFALTLWYIRLSFSFYSTWCLYT